MGVRRTGPLLVMVAAAAVLLVACGDASSRVSGRTVTGNTTRNAAPAGAVAADTPARTGSGQSSGLAGSPSGGGTGGGTGVPGGAAPGAIPGLEALQILGIPVLALPPEVVAAATSPAGLLPGTDTGTGANTGASSSGSSDDGGSASEPPLPTTAEFCGPALDLSAALDAMGAAQSADDLEAAVTWARASFATARATAPPGLQIDVETLAGAFGHLFDAMEAAGYDRARLTPGAFTPLLAPNVTAAQNRFNQYVYNVC